MRRVDDDLSGAFANSDAVQQTSGNNRIDAIDARYLVTVEEAQRLLSLGKTSVFALLADGTLERRRIRGATRITMRSIRALAGL